MAKKETSQAVSRIAAKGLKHPDDLTMKEIRKVCASALSQDETKGDEKSPFIAENRWPNLTGEIKRLRKIEKAALKLQEVVNASDNHDDWNMPIVDLLDALKKED